MSYRVNRGMGDAGVPTPAGTPGVAVPAKPLTEVVKDILFPDLSGSFGPPVMTFAAWGAIGLIVLLWSRK